MEKLRIQTFIVPKLNKNTEAMQESKGRQILNIKFLVPIKLSTQNRK